jgi:hypothetical protein
LRRFVLEHGSNHLDAMGAFGEHFGTVFHQLFRSVADELV